MTDVCFRMPQMKFGYRNIFTYVAESRTQDPCTPHRHLTRSLGNCEPEGVWKAK